MILIESRRFFKSSRILSLTGVLVLALGLGASAVAASLLLAFSSLRYPGMRAQGYATIGEGSGDGIIMPISWNRFAELKTATGMQMVAYSPPLEVQLETNSAQKSVRISAVSSGFFPDFTAPLFAGRNFTPDEVETGHVAILSADISKAMFQSPRDAIGHQVLIKGSPYLVVGVAAPDFHGLFGVTTDAWVPANCVIPLVMDMGGNPRSYAGVWKVLNTFYVVTASDALSSAHLADTANRSFPLRLSSRSLLSAAQGISVDPGKDEVIRRWVRLGLSFSLAFALVSCLNVCLLLMARAPLLAAEVHLKHALGASTLRILIELAIGPLTMMLAGLLASFAFWIAMLTIVSRLAFVNRQLLVGSASTVLWAFVIQAILAVLLIVVISLIPATVALRAGAAPRMGLTSTIGRRTGLFMQAPVAAQIACGVVVWILAGMITSSLLFMMERPLGYDPAHRTVISLMLSGPTTFVSKPGASDEFLALNQVIERLRRLPGVRNVSYVNSAPVVGGQSIENLQNPDDSAALPIAANAIVITSGYFHTMGAKILKGKDVSAWIETGATNEIVLNELAANKLFSGQNPVQRQVTILVPAHYGLPTFRYQARVVGIVENMLNGGYASSPQATFFEEGHAYSDGMPNLVVDGDQSLHFLETAAKEIVAEQMPGMKVRSVSSLEDEVQKTLTPEKNRAFAALVGAAAMAFVSLVGLYGSLSFYLRSKRREMAVRICLGASSWIIRRMVIGRAFLCTCMAALLSLPLWFILRTLSSHDYLGAASWSWGRAVLITLVCIVASTLFACIPAAATSSISPSEVLKEQ